MEPCKRAIPVSSCGIATADYSYLYGSGEAAGNSAAELLLFRPGFARVQFLVRDVLPRSVLSGHLGRFEWLARMFAKSGFAAGGLIAAPVRMRSSGRIFRATSRPSLVSRARDTSPIPPAPSGAKISYGPNLVPGASGMSGGDYNLVRPCATAFS